MSSRRSGAPRSAAAVRRARPAREYRLPCSIHAAMNRADDAWRNELRATSLADIVAAIARDASPKGIEQGINWMVEVLR